MIKKYFSVQDTAITNYKERSGTGESDSLNLFKKESFHSRLLFKFDFDKLRDDISKELINVTNTTFLLKLFNGGHEEKVFLNDKVLEVYRITKDWKEGQGFDFDNWTDTSISNWLFYDEHIEYSIESFDLITNSLEPNQDLTAVLNPGDAIKIFECQNKGIYTVASITATQIVFIEPLVDEALGHLTYFAIENYWETEGGDYIDLLATIDLQDGTKDISTDITSYVENVLNSTYVDYGLMLKLSDVYEQVDEIDYRCKMIYTKSSQYFFKRPLIEAHDVSVKEDNRLRFFNYNINTVLNSNYIYFENIIRGRHQDLPVLPAEMSVKFYLNELLSDEIIPTVINPIERVSTGVYRVEVEISIEDGEDFFYDKWHNTLDEDIVYHTNEIYLNSEDTNHAIDDIRVSLKNKPKYFNSNDIPRFRMAIRNTYFNLNSYVVSTELNRKEIYADDLYYMLLKKSTREVITDVCDATKISYDIKGNFFDIDMSTLKPEYYYVIKICQVKDNVKHIFSEEFDFQVRDYLKDGFERFYNY